MKSAKKVYAGISALPPELIELIVRDLSSSDLHKCTITNLEWHQAFNPYLWRHIRIKVPTSKGVLHAPFIRFKSAVERGAMINIGDMVETLEAGYYDILELLDSDAMVAALERCDNDDKKNDPETNNKNDLETDNKINKDDTGKQTLQSAVRTYKPVCTRLRRLHVGSGIDPACVTTANITAFPVKQTYSGKTITRYQSSAPSPPSTAHGMPIYPTPDVPWNAAPFVFTPLTYPPPITTAFAEPIFSETPVLAVSAASLTTAPALAPASTTITTTPTASQFATAPISPAATEPSFATISSFDAAVAAGIPISGFGSTSTTTSPSHFGAAHTTPASGSTTITATATTTSPFGPFPSSTTTSAFGVTPSVAATTTSLFGPFPSSTTTGAFGVTHSVTTTTASPFGPFSSSTATNAFEVTPSTITTSGFGVASTSLFGRTPTNTTTTRAFGVASTSLFGTDPSTTATASAFGVTPSSTTTGLFGDLPRSTIISLLRTPSTTSSAYDLDLSPLISLLRQNNQLQMLSLQGRLLDPSAAVIGDLADVFAALPASLESLRLNGFRGMKLFCDVIPVATALRDSCHRLNELCLSGHLNSDTNISQMISVSTCGWVTLSIPVLTPYGFETHTTSNYAQRENYFGIESTTALLKHASTLENLCLEGAMGFRSQDIHQLLCSAPRLKRLRLVSEGLSRQWVCQSLEYFACELDGLPRPDLQERAMVNPLLPGLELDLERSYQAHRKIYSRFAQLTCLKVLIFGPSEGRHLFGSKGLPMSLESGLDLLVNLKELEYVECDRVTSKFLNFEVQAWANANWPKYSQGPSAAREFWQRGGYYDDGTGTVQDPFSARVFKSSIRVGGRASTNGEDATGAGPKCPPGIIGRYVCGV
ncbi:hypothetical protein EC991_000472 [Linnemannia zychae]|nr:hypothetical protein EC991_000472 [Linnemannia zychae]